MRERGREREREGGGGRQLSLMVTSHVIARLEFNWKIFNSGAAFCEEAATATAIDAATDT